LHRLGKHLRQQPRLATPARHVTVATAQTVQTVEPAKQHRNKLVNSIGFVFFVPLQRQFLVSPDLTPSHASSFTEVKMSLGGFN
jgi:hypothetical protein